MQLNLTLNKKITYLNFTKTKNILKKVLQEHKTYMICPILYVQFYEDIHFNRFFNIKTSRTCCCFDIQYQPYNKVKKY